MNATFMTTVATIGGDLALGLEGPEIILLEFPQMFETNFEITLFSEKIIFFQQKFLLAVILVISSLEPFFACCEINNGRPSEAYDIK